MLFATAQSYHRVCRGFPPRCTTIPRVTNLRGLGDAIDANDPCTLNPSDPVCQAYSGGSGGSTPAQTGAGSGEIVFGVDPSDCRAGTTWDPSRQICAPNPNIASSATDAVGSLWSSFATWAGSGTSAAGPQIKVGSAPAAAPMSAAIGKMFSFTGLLTIAVLGAAGYGGYRYYKKHKRK